MKFKGEDKAPKEPIKTKDKKRVMELCIINVRGKFIRLCISLVSNAL